VKLQRLFDMSATELAVRGRQQLTRTVDRFVAPKGVANPACRFAAHDGDAVFQRIAQLLEKGDPAATAEELQQRFNEIAPARFFAGFSEDDLAALIGSHCSAAKQGIVDSANAVCRDEFDTLGYGKLNFGSPVNWQFDAVSGQQIAPTHGSRVKYLANNQVGDSKVVWELNRHQWLLDLGQAWRFTGDARYAEAFERHLRHWMNHNPPGFGMNWSSSLEVSMRMISWCWALLLFRGAVAFSPELFLRMLAWIQAHARYVERNLSWYFSPNTHLTGEALGLFYAGTLLPELEGAKRWRKLGQRILLAELDRQVLPGGVYFEQSTRYQHYTVEMYLHFIILAKRNHIEVPASVGTRLEEMVEFLLHVRRPDGTVPQIGDTDGGWLLPLVRREPGDFRGLFSTAATLFNNPQFAWAAEQTATESHGAVDTIWLLGTQVAVDSPRVPTSVAPRCFQEGGYVVMRSGWDERAHQLIFDTGPLGCGVSAGHGHADLLSVQCSAFGENYLVDAGTFCYTADASWRQFFRSSQAHSTVMIDGRSQAEPAGPFSWHSRPSARLLNCSSKPGHSLAEAELDAWAVLNDPVKHRRRVLFVDHRYWMIIDDLCGRTGHRFDLRYQFAPMPVEEEEQGWVRARGNNGALLVKAVSNVPLATTIARGQLDPPAGWYSANYGQKTPAPALTFSAVTERPLRVVTLLLPLTHPQAVAPTVTASIQAGANSRTAVGLTLATGERESIFIEDHEVFIQNGTSTCVASPEY